MAWIRVNKIVGMAGQSETIENIVNTDTIIRISKFLNGSTIYFVDRSGIRVSNQLEELIVLIKQGTWL